MIGFEINIKGNTLFSGVKNGVATIITTQVIKDGTSSIDLSVSGLETGDEKMKKRVYWLDCPLKNGDTFTVKVKEIQQFSTPADTKDMVYNQEEENKKDLEHYYAIKKKLEDKGLI